MSGPPRRDHQRLFWRLIRSGSSIEAASACLGVDATTGLRWFHKAGGMAPLTLDPLVRSRYLSIGEREQILAGMVAGWSIRRIAASIGRHPSTVMREMKRNLNHQQYRSRDCPGIG